MSAEPTQSRFLSRKFILCGMAVVMSFAALLLEQVGETIFRDLLLGSLGLYFAGNVGQKFVTKDTP